jgi:PST family polysaccharide transporter
MDNNELMNTVSKIEIGDLKTRTIDGAFWNVGFAVLNKAVTLVGQLMLAWFLLPADMGLANMAFAMVAFTAILSVGGLGDVLLQRNRFDQEAGQAFWLSVIFSTLTAIAICGLSFMNPFLGKPEVKNMFWLFALATFVGSPATIMAAGLKRNLDYKNLAFSQFVGGVFLTTLTVLLAWGGMGPYSLILPGIPRLILTMWVMWVKGGTFKIEKPKWKTIYALVKPTMSVSVSSLFTGLQTQAPIFVCGLVLDAKETGYFSWGWLVAGQVVFLLATNLREVLLPTLTQMDEDIRLRAFGALKATRIMMAFLCVACGAQALLTEPLIRLFLPNRWYPAIPLIVIFSLCLISQAFWISSMAWLNACGRYQQLIVLSAFQAGLSTGFTWVGASINGVWGASIGCASAFVIGSFVSAWFMRNHVDRKHLNALIKPTVWTILLWGGNYYMSNGRDYITQILCALIFICFDSWIWWKNDDGSLKSVFGKMVGKLKIIHL